MIAHVWIAGTHLGKSAEDEVIWRLLGVFNTEQKARSACVERDDFVAQVPINVELGTGPGSTFPATIYPLT